MKIIISNSGHLAVDVDGAVRNKGCPFSGQSCGDWCPLFGEPEAYVDVVTVYEAGDGIANSVKLSLCQKDLIATELEDLR